ncbi:MAG TPA: hypothetical protein VND93_32895, partial [Myxococcales bacterium]|nr:hypothetical protein [Myxococcales bacterium]
MSAPRTAPGHRRRFTAGVLVAAGVGLFLSHALLHNGLHDVADSAGQRKAAVSLSALAELAARAGGKGDPLRQAVRDWQARTPEARAVRVVLFDGFSLEASTAAADTGDRAAPRRLSPAEERKEKRFYDVGQLLRTAVETNQEERQKRKKEIELVPDAPEGTLAIATPLELEGQVAGVVELEAVPEVKVEWDSPWVWLGTWAGAVIAFAAAAAAVSAVTRKAPASGLLPGPQAPVPPGAPAERWLLSVVAVAATAGALSLFGWYSFGKMEQARRAEHEQV